VAADPAAFCFPGLVSRSQTDVFLPGQSQQLRSLSQGRSHRGIHFARVALCPESARQGPASARAKKRVRHCSGQKEKADALRKINETLSAIREAHSVDWVGELAGHYSGPIDINNTPSLILRGPTHIEPKKGDPAFISDILRTLLADPPEQLDHFLAAFQRSVRLLRAGRYEPQQILFFAGNPNDGKTLLATEILRACLGGRRVDATSYFIGATRFNLDLARCELWIVDDQGDAKGFDRLVYNNNLKKTSADPDVRVEPKGVDAIMARHLPHLVVVLFNLEGRGGSHLMPEIAEDNKDKYLIFRTSAADLPQGPNQYQEIQTRIGAALPAFLNWLLNEYEAKPEVISGDRFQIRPYHHPEVIAYIQETGNAAQLLVLLDQALKEHQKEELFGPTTLHYHDLLNGSAGMAKIIGGMFKSVVSFGRAMSELAARHPERIIKRHTVEGTVYRVLSRAKAEGVAAAEAAGSPEGVVIDAKFKP
jgi:hypothetical protein